MSTSVPSAAATEIRTLIQDSIAAKQAMLNDAVLLGQLETLALACTSALREGGKIIFAGNGGSFADSQHLSAEFTSRLRFDRAPLASIALGTNSSSMSAIGNDYGYEQVFARELQCIATPKDRFIALTTSGNSPNILAAVDVARRFNIPTIGWTGGTGGKLAGMCECMVVPSPDTARIQECHMLMGHILCGLVEAAAFPKERRP